MFRIALRTQYLICRFSPSVTQGSLNRKRVNVFHVFQCFTLFGFWFLACRMWRSSASVIWKIWIFIVPFLLGSCVELFSRLHNTFRIIGILLKLLVSLLNAADKNREYDWRSEYIKARCSVVCFCHSLLRRDGLPGISIALQMVVEWQGLLEHPSISLHHMSLLLSWLFRTFWWFGSSG